MILAAMMLVLAQADVTLGAVERLSPAAAGEVALKGREHRRILRMSRAPLGHNALEYRPALEMFESPAPVAGGCQLRRWTVQFQRGSDTAEEDAVLTGSYSVVMVALARLGYCPVEPYTHVNPSVQPEEALMALGRLDDLTAGRAKVELSCTDATRSRLCISPPKTLKELALMRPWAITRDDRTILVWFRGQGQPGVTEVRLDPKSPERVVVSRSYPPPF